MIEQVIPANASAEKKTRKAGPKKKKSIGRHQMANNVKKHKAMFQEKKETQKAQIFPRAMYLFHKKV